MPVGPHDLPAIMAFAKTSCEFAFIGPRILNPGSSTLTAAGIPPWVESLHSSDVEILHANLVRMASRATRVTQRSPRSTASRRSRALPGVVVKLSGYRRKG